MLLPKNRKNQLFVKNLLSASYTGVFSSRFLRFYKYSAPFAVLVAECQRLKGVKGKCFPLVCTKVPPNRPAETARKSNHNFSGMCNGQCAVMMLACVGEPTRSIGFTHARHYRFSRFRRMAQSGRQKSRRNAVLRRFRVWRSDGCGMLAR